MAHVIGTVSEYCITVEGGNFHEFRCLSTTCMNFLSLTTNLFFCERSIPTDP